jgi:tRNA 2-thiouridine synthesizing protein A
MTGGPILVDSRGMLCPWPALRLSRAARQLGASGTIRVLADDPAAPRELQSLCDERGWELSSDPGSCEFTVKIG